MYFSVLGCELGDMVVDERGVFYLGEGFLQFLGPEHAGVSVDEFPADGGFDSLTV